MEAFVIFVLVVLFVSGIAGLARRLYVAAWLLTAESIDSPHRVRRWVNRYMFFSFYYVLSFLFSPVIALPIIRQLIAVGIGQPWTGIASLLIPVPLAWLLLKFDFWLMRRSDDAKRRGRERLAARQRGAS